MLFRHPLFWAISIFTVAFWLWRLPFTVWLPLPEFAPDTFQYFMIAKYWTDGVAATHDSIGLPLGYPAFIYLAGIISSKVLTVVYLQFLLRFIACLLFIYFTYKNFRWLAIPVAISLSIYATDGFTLRLDTFLYPDSIYSSILIMAAAFLIEVVKSKKAFPIFLLSITMFLAAFVRSNGIYIYFLIPFLIFFFLKESRPLLRISLLIAPALSLHLFQIIAKNTSEYFSNSPTRYTNVLNREISGLDNKKQSYFQRKATLAFDYLKMPDVPSFYYSVLPTTYKSLYVDDIMHDPDYKMFSWSIEIPDDLKKFTFKEYYTELEKVKDNIGMTDFSSGFANPLFFVTHLFYKIQNVVFRNIIWSLLGSVILLASFYFFFKRKFNHQNSFLLLLLSLIHFLSIFIIVFGHSRSQLRYSQVSEFILYLLPIFAWLLISPVVNSRNSDA